MRTHIINALAALLLALAAFVPFAASDAYAAEIEGVTFVDTLEVAETPFELWNVGLLRWKFFFKGYVAALYLAPGEKPESLWTDAPKRLELHYFYSIGGEKFGGAADELLSRWMSPEEIAPLRERLDTLHALYRDVEPGDRYALTYVPGRGMELTLNEESLGVIEGDDFARTYFAIWLGKVPLDEPLRDQLLATREDEGRKVKAAGVF